MRSKTDMDNAMITGNISLYLLFDPILQLSYYTFDTKNPSTIFPYDTGNGDHRAAPDSLQSYRNNFKLFGKYCKLMPFSPLLPYL